MPPRRGCPAWRERGLAFRRAAVLRVFGRRNRPHFYGFFFCRRIVAPVLVGVQEEFKFKADPAIGVVAPSLDQSIRVAVIEPELGTDFEFERQAIVTLVLEHVDDARYNWLITHIVGLDIFRGILSSVHSCLHVS